MGREQLHLSSSPVCYGQKERHRGLSLSLEADHLERVDVESAGRRRNSPSVASEHRSVRDLPKFSTSDILLTHDRPPECRHGRFSPAMVEPASVRFSTSRHSQEGPKQVSRVNKLPTNPNCTILATERMVPRSDESVTGKPSSSSSETRPSETTALPSVSSKPPELESSCLEAGVELA